MTPTGTRRPAATRRSCSSNPLSPPRCTSRTRQPGVRVLEHSRKSSADENVLNWKRHAPGTRRPGARWLEHSRKSSADENVLTWKPPAPRRRRSARRSETSSSMTQTSCERSSWRGAPEPNRPSPSDRTLEPVASPRNALLVPYERADRPGRRSLGGDRRNRVLARKLDAEREPPIGIDFRGDPPPVRLHDRAADGQAHAEAARLGADEPLEHALQLRGLRTDAGVPDADLHDARGPERRRDPDLAGPVRGVADRLAGVHHEIQDYLLELDRIAGHERRDRVGDAEHRDVLASQVV